MFVQIVWWFEFIIIRQVNLKFQKTSEHCKHRSCNCYYCVNNYWMVGGGGWISQIQGHLNTIIQRRHLSFFSYWLDWLGSPRTFSFLKIPCCIWLISFSFQLGYGAFTDTKHLGYIPLGNPTFNLPYGTGPVKICQFWHDVFGREVTTIWTITHYKTFNEINQLQQGIFKNENVLGDTTNPIIN